MGKLAALTALAFGMVVLACACDGQGGTRPTVTATVRPTATATPAPTPETAPESQQHALAGATYTGMHSGGGSVTLTVSPDGSRVEDFDLTFDISGFCGLESVFLGSTGEGVREGAWSSLGAFGSTDHGTLALVVSTGRVLATPAFAYEEAEVGLLSATDADISISLGGSFLSGGDAEGTFAIHIEGGGSVLDPIVHSCDSGTLTWSATAQ